ncbi:Holliday junction resolvase RuvX [Acetivibrio mesophilus]|uniref:Putative pre-16S rRNA nuclease n=1 Tax=Acetivibrio mesophilus TaxID=2487273 RepID=A0A4V1K264_9FIRM|nr:Holliday junction resolvase RuvX [Acetivibrio mesophilus]ODM26005.1 Holliday junction DNA helicase RuvA [Clostridium sp. Bc-iso-3]RXE59199.1 Holliday junction resolvase RuvX [Acetivibrio mesophilus]HHV29212.1 Holliday junction resolvase RuvX [Clostridium sp.]
MRIMGIDYGDSRIGIAISDPLGWTAQALETISWKTDVEVPIKRISELIEDYEIKTVIIGFPKNMDGTVGVRGEKTIEFVELLTQRVKDIEVIKWDERLTTVAANRTMHEMGVKKSKKKLVVDQIAAVYILQGYLDSQGKA